MDELTLLDQVDGRLTRLTIGYPTAWGEIWKVQKHVRYALKNPRQTNVPKYIEQTKGRMTALAVKYPDFAEHLMPIVQLIEREQEYSRADR
jgi:hypothetical protein